MNIFFFYLKVGFSKKVVKNMNLNDFLFWFQINQPFFTIHYNSNVIADKKFSILFDPLYIIK